MATHRHLNILGTRGIPAAHGGFETFAEKLALYLVSYGHSVTVYCQSDQGQDVSGREDYWRGIHRVHFGSRTNGALGTAAFDTKCVRHVLNQPGVDLVLGYNTAILTALQRLRKRTVYMNMDGIEWQRQKWSMPLRTWLKANEWLGARLATQPIADHPGILEHIRARTGRRAVMIPYGADHVASANPAPLRNIGLGLQPGRYFLTVARLEPENSILEIIEAHNRAETAAPLVVLGRLCSSNSYHRRLCQVAGPNVMFPGGIYDRAVLNALRFHARAYLHGHQVGGTNPSLVEALGAGNAVIAHDNEFNRWTVGPEQMFFKDIGQCTDAIAKLWQDDLLTKRAQMAARARFSERFRWDDILAHYRSLMLDVTGIQVAAE